MPGNSLEDYIGAIYRLRPANGDPLPLNRLQEFFGFSPISIHEMVTKLEQHGLLDYLPYKGVRLSPKGEEAASNLIRRHRIWERFLTDRLNVPWDESHTIAGELEHAAPDWITERLAELIGNPEACPHGDTIPATDGTQIESTDILVKCPGSYRISKISPEIPAYLARLSALELIPGRGMEVTIFDEDGATIWINDRNIVLPPEIMQTVWVLPQP